MNSNRDYQTQITNLQSKITELKERLKTLEIENQDLKDNETIVCDYAYQLKEEVDLFKLAFYSLWKCCNSKDSITDFENTDYYIEFKVGYESVYIGLSLEEMQSIEKACELLDIEYHKEVSKDE